MENSEHIVLSIEKEYDAWLECKEEDAWLDSDSELEEEEDTPRDIEMGIELNQETNLKVVKKNISILSSICLTNQINLVKRNINMLLCLIVMNNML
jgi:endonuclease III-like uncharacterized protein